MIEVVGGQSHGSVGDTGASRPPAWMAVLAARPRERKRTGRARGESRQQISHVAPGPAADFKVLNVLRPARFLPKTSQGMASLSALIPFYLKRASRFFPREVGRDSSTSSARWRLLSRERPQAIRILLVAPAPPLVGGQAVQAQRLLENLRREPHLRVELQSIAPRFFPRLQRVRYLRTVLTMAKYVFELLRKTPRADIVHVFAASYFAFLLSAVPAILIAKLFGKKVILNYRSGEAERFFRGWGRHCLRIVRLADEVVAPSGYLVDVFEKFGIRARSIFNVIDTAKFTFRDREMLRPVFLSNRILEPLYNIDCILRAYRIVLEKFPDARLVVCNDGPERQRLERAARTLKLSNVEFIGLVPPSKIGELYAVVDVYLNSPNFDCMPGSLIECFASGVPVVSTRAGGIPYIVTDGETGLLVDTDDHEAMAARAMYLLENPSAAREIIEKARRECARYEWTEIRPRWLDLYEQLAGRPRRADHAPEGRRI